MDVFLRLCFIYSAWKSKNDISNVIYIVKLCTNNSPNVSINFQNQRNWFFQVRSFIQDQNSHVFDYQILKIERLLLNRGKKSVLGQGYAELNLASNISTDYLRQVWNNDLNLRMDETTWAEIWEFAKEISICNRTRETQFRILRRLQITPQLSHRSHHPFHPSKNKMLRVTDCKKGVPQYASAHLAFLKFF